MNIPVTFEVIIGVLGGVVVAMLVLLVLQARNSVAVTRLSAPAYAYLQEEGKKQAKQLLDEAKAEAEKIKQAAVAERSSLLAAVEHTLNELRDSYAKKLETGVDSELSQLSDDATEQLAAIRSQLQAVHQELMKAKQTATATTGSLEDAVKNAKTTIETNTKTALDHFEETLQAAANSAKEQLTKEGEQLQAALEAQQATATKALAEHMQAYQEEREKMLDTHILQIVEMVTKEVLHKQLTITEHADLAQAALKRAKQDTVI